MVAGAEVEVRDLLGRGEYLRAADAATDQLGPSPSDDDPELVWLAGLALARCGAVDRAESLLGEAALMDRTDDLPLRLAEDILALGARLKKDRALAGSVDEGQAQDAARAYAVVADRFDSGYAAANAATLALLGGDHDSAQRYAQRALELTDSTGPDYWNLVTRAEASLVLGDGDGAREAIAAADQVEADWSMRATTRRQLGLLCKAAGVDRGILDLLNSPSVAHFTGHMFAAGPEDELRRQVTKVLTERQVGALYGSLACGSDILIAEAALELELEVNAFLPCPVEQFIESSVRPGGEQWVERFEALLERAFSVQVEPTGLMGDEAMFAYCDQLAMGSALIRSRNLVSPIFQLALWDGEASSGAAGAGAAVGAWSALGHPTHSIGFDRQRFEPVDATAAAHPESGPERSVRALLFADVKGFSALRESELPSFFETVMGSLARVLDEHGETLLHRNTWGDGLYLVFSDPVAAAVCAGELQDQLAELSNNGLEVTARIGGHAGPVFSGFDHVRKEPTFFGTHVNRAARIEPRTPPGEVYLTASLAALVALSGSHDFRLEYVGEVPTAKDYGEFPMYVLRRS